MLRPVFFLASLFALMLACDPSTESSAGNGLLEYWPREGPELLWIYEGLGKGYAVR